MSSEPSQNPIDLQPSKENICWAKTGICRELAESLEVSFSRSSSGSVRRKMSCSYTTLSFLAFGGTALGYDALKCLAKEFGVSNSANAPAASLFIVVATIFVLELMALDEEITNGELPEEVTEYPEFCSTIQAWLPHIGTWCYHNLIRTESPRHRLYDIRTQGEPLVLTKVATTK